MVQPISPSPWASYSLSDQFLNPLINNALELQELIYLEQDDEALTEVFPQGEKVCIHWPFGVLYTFAQIFKKSMKELVFHALWYGRQIPHGHLLSSAT
jgi:hypothetical protein